MMHYKPLATAMIPNMMLNPNLDSDLVNPLMHKQWIGPFMYMVNTRTKYVFQ